MVMLIMCMSITCVVLIETVMHVVDRYVCCNMCVTVEPVVFEYIGVFMCGITVVITRAVSIDTSGVGV